MEEFFTTDRQLIMMKGTDFARRGLICVEICTRAAREGKRVAVYCSALMRTVLRFSLSGDDALCTALSHIAYKNGGGICFVTPKNIRRVHVDVLISAVDGVGKNFFTNVLNVHAARGTKMYILCAENDVELSDRDGGTYARFDLQNDSE